jgi:rRNA maturation endonuclease Nob1
MSDHPYSGGNTLVPGEMATDDPFSEEERCENCDEHVTPIPETGDCPRCGEEVV